MDKKKIIKKYTKLMDSAIIRDYYGKSGFLNVGYWKKQNISQAQASEELVSEILAPVNYTPSKILDVACGMGATTNYIHNRYPNAEITGINISPHQVDICKARWDKLSFIEMNAANLKFEDNTFDLVASVEAAVHFDSRKKFFKEAYRVLQENGKLVLSDLTFSIRLDWITAPSNKEKNEEDIRDSLKEAGFKDIKIQEVKELTWDPYYKNILKWGMTQKIKNRITSENYTEIMQAGKITKNLPITYYFLIEATK